MTDRSLVKVERLTVPQPFPTWLSVSPRCRRALRQPDGPHQRQTALLLLGSGQEAHLHWQCWHELEGTLQGKVFRSTVASKYLV